MPILLALLALAGLAVVAKSGSSATVVGDPGAIARFNQKFASAKASAQKLAAQYRADGDTVKAGLLESFASAQTTAAFDAHAGETWKSITSFSAPLASVVTAGSQANLAQALSGVAQVMFYKVETRGDGSGVVTIELKLLKDDVVGAMDAPGAAATLAVWRKTPDGRASKMYSNPSYAPSVDEIVFYGDASTASPVTTSTSASAMLVGEAWTFDIEIVPPGDDSTIISKNENEEAIIATLNKLGFTVLDGAASSNVDRGFTILVTPSRTLIPPPISNGSVIPIESPHVKGLILRSFKVSNLAKAPVAISADRLQKAIADMHQTVSGVATGYRVRA